jgi:hypothetical protein
MLEKICEKYRETLIALRETGEFDDLDAYESFYEYFATTNGEMPYGTAKARTGDPDQWIYTRLQNLIVDL